jgi:hypothetical protein
MPEPTPPTSVNAFTEIGISGLKQQGGRVQEEWLPQLKGKQGANLYREMIDNDPIIGGIAYAVEEVLRSVSWSTNPYDDSPESLAAAQFVDECRHDMAHTWGDFVGDALSKMGYGWSLFEVCYKQRGGDDGDYRSRFNDGRVGWRKFAYRAQDTLERWEFDDDGGIRGMWQSGATTAAGGGGRKDVFIPIEKALLFRTTTRKGNPEGRSIFRNSYTSWWTKKRVEWFELIGIERDLAGIPSFGLPPEYFQDTAPSEMKSALTEFKKAATQLRRDEQSALVWPKFMDENGNQLIEIGLLKAPGARQHNTGEVIERNARWMAISTLQDMIMLGHEHVGSLALADVKKQMAATALRAQLQEIADVLNRHELPRLFRLNGLPLENMPELVPGEIENRDINQLALVIAETTKAGMTWFPNDEIEREIFTMLGFDPGKVKLAEDIREADETAFEVPTLPPAADAAEPDDDDADLEPGDA